MLQLQAISKSLVAGSDDCKAIARVLDGVCFTISAGQIAVVSAGAGSGKTTLLWCMAGLLQPDSGSRRLLDPERSAVRYWPGSHDWRRAVVRDTVGAPALHLFDEPAIGDFAGARAEFCGVLRRLGAARHAAVIATAAPILDFIAIVPREARYYHLERGRLVAAVLPPTRAVAMVAERRAPAFG